MAELKRNTQKAPLKVGWGVLLLCLRRFAREDSQNREYVSQTGNSPVGRKACLFLICYRLLLLTQRYDFPINTRDPYPSCFGREVAQSQLQEHELPPKHEITDYHHPLALQYPASMMCQGAIW